MAGEIAVADIGLIGLAVMGQNIILNMNDHKFKVICFNRDTTKVDKFLDNEAKGKHFIVYVYCDGYISNSFKCYAT